MSATLAWRACHVLGGHLTGLEALTPRTHQMRRRLLATRHSITHQACCQSKSAQPRDNAARGRHVETVANLTRARARRIRGCTMWTRQWRRVVRTPYRPLDSPLADVGHGDVR
jgi:hypothetical protein